MQTHTPAVDTATVCGLFRDQFSAEPAVVASAPGRVNLIGEHTDYNGGEVLPIAIEQRTWVAVGLAPNGRSRAISANATKPGEWEARAPLPSGEWWDYVSGIAGEASILGWQLPPVNVAVVSDVPLGAGLSSSAALEVAAAFAFAAIAGARLSAEEAALLGHRVETVFVGVDCGIMDQFASGLGVPGHALHLWCDSRRYEHIAIEDAVLIFDTGISHSLRTAAYNVRRRECEAALVMLRRDHPELPTLAAATTEQIAASDLPSPLDRRARHVVEETRRVQSAVESLAVSGALPDGLLYESHESLRSLYECSSPELDWFVERAAAAPGVTGARLTGAGWGGCAIAVGDDDALAEACRALAGDYEARFGRKARAWLTRASEGARLEKLAR